MPRHGNAPSPHRCQTRQRALGSPPTAALFGSTAGLTCGVYVHRGLPADTVLCGGRRDHLPGMRLCLAARRNDEGGRMKDESPVAGPRIPSRPIRATKDSRTSIAFSHSSTPVHHLSSNEALRGLAIIILTFSLTCPDD